MPSFYEIELKFKISNFGPIRKMLEQKEGKFIGKVFERTLRFDTPQKHLEKKGQFLRIRTGFRNTITFKQKLKNKERNFKVREEIELEISDPQKMEKILKSLGFLKAWIMEKYREKWHFKNTEIALDKLPMGNFIEIEGSRKSIEKVISVLSLDPLKRITLTYWDLWKEFSKEKGIKEENIVFPKYVKNQRN